jgi:hypothetical protein
MVGARVGGWRAVGQLALIRVYGFGMISIMLVFKCVRCSGAAIIVWVLGVGRPCRKSCGGKIACMLNTDTGIGLGLQHGALRIRLCTTQLIYGAVCSCARCLSLTKRSGVFETGRSMSEVS